MASKCLVLFLALLGAASTSALTVHGSGPKSTAQTATLLRGGKTATVVTAEEVEDDDVVDDDTRRRSEDLLKRFRDDIFQLSYTCKKPKRLGHRNDGGYMICEDVVPPAGNCVLFGYGISKSDDFEVALSKNWNCEVEEFDPTVNNSPGAEAKVPRIHFHHEGLWSSGPEVLPNLGPVDTLPHQEAKYRGKGKVLVVKIDVEESEYSSILATPESLWDTVDQLVIELHTSDMFAKEFANEAPADMVLDEFARRVDTVDLLRRHFYLTHVHLNNWEISQKHFLPGQKGKGSAGVPGAVELTFVRKGLVTPGPGPFDNHSEMDEPCNPKAPDLPVPKV